MHTRFDGDQLLLIVEPGDQVEVPRFDRIQQCAELQFYTQIHREEIAGWLMATSFAVRLFGENCHAFEVEMNAIITRIRVYIPTGI